MNPQNRRGAGIILSMMCFLQACAAQDTTVASQGPRVVADPPRKILFIGNSLTYSNDGIYTHLQKLTSSAAPPMTIEADKAVVGGQYFKSLWETFPEPRRAIARGYDVVVLQEDLPETKVADFKEYAAKFVDEIRKTGGRPVLLMAWAYRRLSWISMAEIAQAHRQVGKDLGVDVAPVGLAWERVTKERPELNLFKADLEHPNIHGTYLATAVVYATVFRRNPAELSYVPSGITPEAAAFIRKVAWETVEDYSK
jgi:hypothetical protein